MISNYFSTLFDRINLIKQQIQQLEPLPSSVKLLAVSKGQSAEAIKLAYQAGLVNFAESYLQESQIKMRQLSELPLIWHFIGPIQSNKIRSIAASFSWIHSVSSLKIAQKLNEARPKSLPSINICLQINLDDEDSKTGVAPENAAELAAEIMTLPQLHLRGLMAIPKQQTDEQQQYLSFLRLTELRDRLNQELGLAMDTLSMGMSHDFQAAIRAGSTMVRIGRAIFGER